MEEEFRTRALQVVVTRSGWALAPLSFCSSGGLELEVATV